MGSEWPPLHTHMPTHITCNLPISSYRPFPPFSKLLHTPATHCRLAVTWCGSFTVPRPRNVLQKTKDRSSACTCSTITCVSMIIYSEVGICPFRRIQCTLRMLMKHIINTIMPLFKYRTWLYISLRSWVYNFHNISTTHTTATVSFYVKDTRPTHNPVIINDALWVCICTRKHTCHIHTPNTHTYTCTVRLQKHMKAQTCLAPQHTQNITFPADEVKPSQIEWGPDCERWRQHIEPSSCWTWLAEQWAVNTSQSSQCHFHSAWHERALQATSLACCTSP